MWFNFNIYKKNTLVCTLFQWITITNALPNTEDKIQDVQMNILSYKQVESTLKADGSCQRCLFVTFTFTEILIKDSFQTKLHWAEALKNGKTHLDTLGLSKKFQLVDVNYHDRGWLLYRGRWTWSIVIMVWFRIVMAQDNQLMVISVHGNQLMVNMVHDNQLMVIMVHGNHGPWQPTHGNYGPW